MKTLKDLLRELHACSDARYWAQDKTIEEIVKDCHRGDWLLWLAKRIDIPLKELTLAKAYCAKTVEHLMKEERSKSAIKVAIDFGNGIATRDELDAAADAAYAAAYAAYAAAAYADDAAYAADAANDAADYAANATAAYAAAAYAAAAYAAAAYAAADYAANAAANAADADAYDAAKKANQQKTADICRQYIGQLIIESVNKLLIPSVTR